LITYIGIDGEMSGIDIEAGHKLIQIGLAKYNEDGGMDHIGFMIDPGEMAWSMEAQEVHQFTQEDVKKFGLEPEVVDPAVANWANPSTHRRDFVMVGFNVGSFDRPFIKQTLPLTYGKFSRRSVDINSLIFSMADTNTQFERIKAKAKDYAFEKMDGMFDDEFKNRQHDAEYDAVMSLYCFEYLRTLNVPPPESMRRLKWKY
jgi:DNA polymerase III alpha subunit (gram-positive type)